MKMLVKLYLNEIIAGEITIDDVPTKLQNHAQCHRNSHQFQYA